MILKQFVDCAWISSADDLGAKTVRCTDAINHDGVRT